MYNTKQPYMQKWQLVDWAATYFKEPRHKFNRWSKARLFAVRMSVIKKQESL